MHLNYFFLSKLASFLAKELTGAKILECYSQNKNELAIIFLHQDKRLLNIRINLSPNFSFINFPETLHRSKKNSISMFEEVYEASVQDIRIALNDRVLFFYCTGNFTIVVKFHGSRSNIILAHKNETVAVFRRRLQESRNLSIEDFNRVIDFSRDVFQETMGNLDNYPTLGPFIKRRLKERFEKTSTIEERWEVFHQTLIEVENDKLYITHEGGMPIFSLIEWGDILSRYDDLKTALNEFTKLYLRELKLTTLKKKASSLLVREERKNIQSLQALEVSLQKLEGQSNYKLYGDLLIANLHKVDQYEEQVTLEDFQTGKLIKIPLKKGLSPQKNAENYYRKSKNQNIQISRNKEALKLKTEFAKEISGSRKLLEQANSIEEIEQIIAPFEKVKAEKAINLPYKVFVFMGYEIRVGRNARSNDLTTFKNSYKEDLWLHVKDASGSHVLIKHQSGSNFPKPVIERAAQLAASNSRRKTEGLVPVIFTPRKFVRKRKGDPPGSVIVDKEEIILVEPTP